MKKKQKNKKIPIRTYDTAKKSMVFVGYLKDGVFIRKVNNKHFMVIEKGYGLQFDVINELIMADCKKIIIKGIQHEYESTLNQWENKPLRNYGHGLQKFLDIEHMRRIK